MKLNFLIIGLCFQLFLNAIQAQNTDTLKSKNLPEQSVLSFYSTPLSLINPLFPSLVLGLKIKPSTTFSIDAEYGLALASLTHRVTPYFESPYKHHRAFVNLKYHIANSNTYLGLYGGYIQFISERKIDYKVTYFGTPNAFQVALPTVLIRHLFPVLLNFGVSKALNPEKNFGFDFNIGLGNIFIQSKQEISNPLDYSIDTKIRSEFWPNPNLSQIAFIQMRLNFYFKLV